MKTIARYNIANLVIFIVKNRDLVKNCDYIPHKDSGGHAK